VTAFNQADVLITTEVYSAGETPIPGVSGRTLFEQIQQHGHNNVRFEPDMNKIPRLLREIAEPNDLILIQGAGTLIGSFPKSSPPGGKELIMAYLNPPLKLRPPAAVSEPVLFQRGLEKAPVKKVQRTLIVKPGHIAVFFLVIAAIFLGLAKVYVLLITCGDLAVKRTEVIAKRDFVARTSGPWPIRRCSATCWPSISSG